MNKTKLQEEALEWLKANPNKGLFGAWIIRSCWDCNMAHNHLKNADYPFECYDCGNIFFKGTALQAE